jgi:hypothetical protein
VDPGNVPFNTTSAICVQTSDTVNGWNASNVTGRTCTVNGTAVTIPAGGSLDNQPAVPAGANGLVTWQWSAGAVSYASMSLF